MKLIFISESSWLSEEKGLSEKKYLILLPVFDLDCNKTGANKLSLPQSSLAVLLSHSKTNTRHNTYVQADDVTNVDHQFSDYRYPDTPL